MIQLDVNAERFIKFNDISDSNGKYKTSLGTSFPISERNTDIPGTARPKVKNVEGFGECQNIPNSEVGKRRLTCGYIDYKRDSELMSANKFQITDPPRFPDAYDVDDIMRGFESQSTKPRHPIVPWGKLVDRVHHNSIYQHVLYEEPTDKLIPPHLRMKNGESPAYVSYLDFLPNSIVCSPMRSANSQTMKQNQMKIPHRYTTTTMSRNQNFGFTDVQNFVSFQDSIGMVTNEQSEGGTNRVECKTANGPGNRSN